MAFEQLFYGIFLIPPGSPIRMQYFFSSFLIGFVCFVSLIVSIPKEKITGLGYPVLEMVPLAIGMTIALNRMFATTTVLLNIPTLYLAIIYGGAVLFLLDYIQSGILYCSLAIASIYLADSNIRLASNIPFSTDFFVNNLIAWAISAVNYRKYVQEQRNIAIIESQNVQLRLLSEHDDLTGLINRRKIDSIITDLLEHRQGGSAFTAVILFDLDHFKQVNDTFGHQRGDALLKEVSSFIKSRLLEDEAFARWGGEEFLILTKRDGKMLAESLRKEMEQTQFASIGTITASFGVSPVLPDDTDTKIFRQVDQALYRAKETGRNRVEVFTGD